MKFPCTQCGACCRMVKYAPVVLFPQEWVLPDGSCKNLKEDNTCAVYKTRPDVCNLKTMVKKHKMNKFTEHKFYYDNAVVCNTLMDSLGIKDKKIDLTIFGNPLKK